LSFSRCCAETSIPPLRQEAGHSYTAHLKGRIYLAKDIEIFIVSLKICSAKKAMHYAGSVQLTEALSAQTLAY